MDKSRNTFLPLYVTNFFGTLNDNFLKMLASFTVIGWLPDERVKSIAIGVTAGALVLPHILCSPAKYALVRVRTRGLWGSIWSRKGRKDSPSFVPTFVKSVFLWFFWPPFVPRRRVTMHVEDLTGRVKEWSGLTRLEFNRKA